MDLRSLMPMFDGHNMRGVAAHVIHAQIDDLMATPGFSIPQFEPNTVWINDSTCITNGRVYLPTGCIISVKEYDRLYAKKT